MKIALISANQTTSPYPVFPLGASVVCSALKQAGHDVLFIDWLAEGLSRESLLERIRRHEPQLLCLSLRNVDNTSSAHEEKYLDAVAELVATARTVTSVPILVGGAGFSLMPEIILERIGADYGIVGEGERQVLDFVSCLERGEQSAPVISRAKDFLGELELGSADYALPCLDYYVAHGGGMIGVQTKRGCLHHCTYCSYPLLEGRRLRLRDPKKVVSDIERLVNERLMRYLYFVDAVFNDHQRYFMQVIEEMLTRKVRIPWIAFFKPTPISDEDLVKMKETGWASAEIGSDGTTDETLRGLRKPFTWDDIKRFQDSLHRHQIPAAHYFIFGGPGETQATAQKGIEQILSLIPSVRFIYSGIRILPDTEIEQQSLREGIIQPGQSLLEPAYYFSPQLDRAWLENLLREKLAGDSLCFYPPESFSDRIAELHRKGFCGPLWELLLGQRPPRRIRSRG
jgi:lipid biosynthesis B12-binding/radical SAM protein